MRDKYDIVGVTHLQWQICYTQDSSTTLIVILIPNSKYSLWVTTEGHILGNLQHGNHFIEKDNERIDRPWLSP